MKQNKSYQIVSIKKLLTLPLSIPCYQRAYKWTTKNIADLTSDIDNAILESTKYTSFRYRVGTIILHKKTNNHYDIVDGQQRCISLLLIYYNLCNKKFTSELLSNKINAAGKENIYNNYKYINNWLSFKNENDKEKIKKAFECILECVVLIVYEEKNAFQLFDSQNSRGKGLYPHDLLKAYHLREMKDSPFDMLYAVEKWEAIEPTVIKELFGKYLFPILKWSRREKSTTFIVKDIDVYKGIKENYSYTYAKRVSHSMPIYQITEPFLSGNDFFEMVVYYVRLLEHVKKEISQKIENMDRSLFEMLKKETSTGFTYAKTLLECALFYYYDKFKNLNDLAVKNIIVWVLMLRVDMEVLSFASVNNYAIGNESQYSNNLPLFSIIKNARLHNEIGSLTIQIREKSRSKNWDELLEALKRINSYDR